MTAARSFLAGLCALAVVLGSTSCAGGSPSRTVSVLGTWVGDEGNLFVDEVLKPFEKSTGIDVQYEGTRDFSAVLESRVRDGDPPDLALLASPGQLQQYAQDGQLVPLDGKTSGIQLDRIRAEYTPAWLHSGLATDAGGIQRQFGVVVRGKRKNVIWYSQAAWGRARLAQPRTWEDLVKVTGDITSSAPLASSGSAWCAGLRDSSSSGWPGTDWIEDIILRDAGADTYRSWYQGTLPWTSPQVQNAWLAWKRIIEVSPAPQTTTGMLLDGIQYGEEEMFHNPPACYLRRIGYLQTSDYQRHAADFGYFDLPPAGGGPQNIEIAGDLLTMFRQSDQAADLVNYLTSVEAQDVWVKPGGAISPNKRVTAYPDETTNSLAQSVNDANLGNVVFDASDAMPLTMRNAFYQAVLEFVAEPDRLPAILKNLDVVRCQAYPEAASLHGCP
ncbi:carbohydrate ABC transporter substrate-binding protein [Frankia sp. AgB1.9]|uniref:ABC transporter substrate-binding protein n=1 Tax=unclassified Frankia TaxID=2632575 RepID=UPI0019326572|nr:MULTISPECIES: ABC transporter substrate-binding protein [unclassified Frankia]MBL7489984.1 carbohydrate ABC transporter substrate-binding protein [Frankia sp. AgW1.1]MBL7553160.1 carbohydrate ABC transporter substrate-binding protein [Frankia sp. AgB1.9]MBL7622197.1 carbohydrate ABC transporter substrate-binding protein [Frankia sp. AgB1.8]